ncbi:MAG TPA: D-2-hydroxyacid dehydrogenase [Anseongella sp.]|nr:D-2-hydroxyacid dehydrogenase [Anseongella sp.]
MSSNIKIFVHTFLNEESKAFLRSRLPGGTAAVFLDEIAKPDLEEEFAGAAYVYGNPPVGWLRGKDMGLRWIQLYSSGFSEYQGLKGDIPVSNMHGYFARPCAETAVAGILALYRKIDDLTLLKSRKEWVGGALRPKMKLLQGKKVILLGSGTIAGAVAEILSGFRCRVDLYGRTHAAATVRSREELLRLLPQADIVVNTLPGTAETREFVSASLLKSMHPAAVFVNIGRGSTVDEPALIKALEEGWIGGAVLDVYAEEPLPPSSRLWNSPNTILTQHTGGGSEEEEKGRLSFFLENLNRVMTGGTPLNLVDLRKGY